MWEAAVQSPTYKALHWTWLRRDPSCFTPTVNSEGVSLDAVWWLDCAPHTDLWAVKDGQINKPCIPDRIRSLHLHDALPSTPSLCLPSPSGWSSEKASGRWHPAGKTKGHHTTEDNGIWHLTSNGNICRQKDWTLWLMPQLPERVTLLWFPARKKSWTLISAEGGLIILPKSY